jgi:hypothetical protein
LFGVAHLAGAATGTAAERLTAAGARVLRFDDVQRRDDLLAATAPDDEALDAAVGAAFDGRGVLDWRRR